jgi:hypothetical protein
MTKTNPVRPAGLIALLAFTILTATLGAQAVKEYQFPGRYQKRSAQGLAIYNDTAFLLNDWGHCRVYDLPTRRLLREFDLASAGADNHANCASFGVEFPEGDKSLPALYVPQCRKDCACFVESVGEGGPKLLQTLRANTGTAADRSFDWVVDREQKCLYTLATQARNFDQKGTNSILITKLPLPPLEKSEVVFHKKDIIEQFPVEFPNLTQGAAVRGGYLYMPVGLHDSAKSGAKNYKSREIIVVNLKTRRIEKTLDLNAVVAEEPEDAAFHGDTLLLYVGQAGGLYKIENL